MSAIDLLIGDSIEEMGNIPDNYIHSCMTSPPYYQQRDYGVEGQIGLEDSVEEYIDKMVMVFHEVRRILRPDGTLWLNLGEDSKYKNKRSVWTIPSVAYKGSHFATFPLKLVDVCLKAGTSENGCCPTCGAPHARIVDQTFVPQQDVKDLGKLAKGSNKGLDASCSWGDYPRGSTITKTIGWKSTCSCPAGDPTPCIVLDPFAGSGTVGKWCRHNNRDCILIELNGNYKPQIDDSIMASVPPLGVYL